MGVGGTLQLLLGFLFKAELLTRFIFYCDFCNLFFKRIVRPFSVSDTHLARVL